MRFLKKTDALNYYRITKNDKLKLFQRDINQYGSKEFIVTSPNQIYNRIKLESSSHYYEFWSDKCKMAFSLDIDMKVNKDYDYKSKIIEIINNVLQGASKYYNYKYKPNNIIVLQNDEVEQNLENPNKVSFHIIFKGLTFENHIVCKDFFIRLTKDFKMEYCDKSIYNLSCLRMCFNSKKGKNAILKPVTYTINGLETSNIKDYDNTDDCLKEFWKNTMITNIKETDRIINKSTIKTAMNILQPKYLEPSDTTVGNVNLENILFQLSNTYYDDYDKWTKIGMILQKISTIENDYYELWDRWSQQSIKYNAGEMNNKWKSFIQNNNKCGLGLGTLIKWCKDEGIINIYKNNKKSTDTIINEYPESKIIISDNYMNSAKIYELEKLTPEIFKPFLNSKLLAIQSEKGTGKTCNLLSALFDKNNISHDTSILFLSSRRTFGIKLLSDLKVFGFKLYSEITDPYICSKRIICQIDSLMRLERDRYDYVIIDECESLARYLTSTHFTKNPKASIIVSSLENRIAEANHVYIMDADLSDRCLNYYNKVMNVEKEETTVIVNTFKPYTKYQIEYMSYPSWLNIIMNDIKAGKNLVIPMASNNKAKDLKTKIERDFPLITDKILLIHKETSDEDKIKKLLRVNEEWQTYQIVIYTPSVCMGVSFDIPNYFDNIYAYGCSNSLGAQEFCQMLHRVRSPKNDIIYMAMDYYKEHTDDDHIDYQTVEQMLCSDYYLTSYELHSNLIPKKISRTINARIIGLDDNIDDLDTSSIEVELLMGNGHRDKIMTYPYKEEPIYDLYVRNSWESIEDKLNFSSKFFGYTKHKGYKLLYIQNDPQGVGTILQDMKNIRTEREENEITATIDGILKAPDLTNDEYLNKIRQREEYLDNKDRDALTRYNLVKCYNLKKNTDEEKTLEHIMTKEFIETYHDKEKMRWFRNITTIINTDDQSTNEKLEIMKDDAKYGMNFKVNCYLDFKSRNKYTYHHYAIKIINDLQFDINDLNKKKQASVLSDLLNPLMDWCQTHKIDIIKTYDMLKYFNKDLPKLDIKQEKLTERLRFINMIICSQYGLKIKKYQNSVNEDVDGNLYRLQYADDNLWKNPYVNPIEKTYRIIAKREEADRYNDFDSSQLDLFIDDTTEDIRYKVEAY